MKRLWFVTAGLAVVLGGVVFFLLSSRPASPTASTNKRPASRSATSRLEASRTTPNSTRASTSKFSTNAATRDPEPTVEGKKNRDVLLKSLQSFASAKSYHFGLEYRLTARGGDLVHLTSNGDVREHKYTHATTTCLGMQSEVVSNGAQVMTRALGAPEWQPVDTGASTGDSPSPTSPATFLEVLNSAVMQSLEVEHEGEKDVNGHQVVVLALPWNQALGEQDVESQVQSEGKIRFFVDPKSQQIMQWQMDSRVRQADPSEDIHLELTCDLSQFDQGWNVDLPAHVRDYLRWQ